MTIKLEGHAAARAATDSANHRRSIASRARIRQHLAASAKAGGTLAIGTPTEITTTHQKERTMNFLSARAVPAKAPLPPVPANPRKAIDAAVAAAAKALGLPVGSSAELVSQMLDACIVAVRASPAAVEAAARRASLSAREAAMLSAKKGATIASVRRYLASKRLFRGRA